MKHKMMGTGRTGLWLRRIGVISVMLLAVGCTTLPRGAAIQSEILASDGSADFAHYPVTKAFLPVVAKWPLTGQGYAHGWVPHGHNHAGLVSAPGDRLNLVIWDSAPNSLLIPAGETSVTLPDIPINGAGSVFIPYIGKVHVAGLGSDAIRNKLQRQLEEQIPSAQLQAQLIPGKNNHVDLVGGVAAPGSYVLDGGQMSVLNLIAQGGGVLPDLRNPQLRLHRGGKTYAKSLAAVYEYHKFDAALRRGDKLIIAADDRYFRALGAAGSETLTYFTQDHMSALDAITLMGGLSDGRANPAGVLILRQYGSHAVHSGHYGPDNARTIFSLDLTTADGLFSAGSFAVHPGDTVFVTESPLNNTRTILSLIGSVFGIASTASNATD